MADILSEEIILAVDQEPFEANSNWFTILYPLLTVHGERLEANVSTFPNRVRVWYMVQPSSLRRKILPGMLWHGMIEETSAFKAYDPDRDKYQVSLRHAFSPGAPQFIEIIDLPMAEPDIALVRQEKPLTLDRRPLGEIFLRGRETVLGPFAAAWESGEVRLNSHDGEVIRMPRGLFEEHVRIEDFVHEANQFDRHHPSVLFNYHLIHRDDLDWDMLRREGETVDARPDRDVLALAANQLQFSRAEKQDLKRLLQRLQEVSLSENLVDRIRDVRLDLEQGLENIEGLVDIIGEIPQFKQLIEDHIEEVTRTRIQEQVTVRQITIQNELRALEEKRQKVEADLRRLRQVYDERVAKQDEELRQRYEQRVAALEKRDRELKAREQAITQQEARQQAEVKRLLEEYDKRGTEIADDMLLRLPVLKTLLASPGSGSAEQPDRHAAGSPRRELHLPAFVKMEKSFEHELSESEFIEQFRDVVAQRGFTFDDLDLINFHVCMKTGILTLVGGQSGTGKSSLPLLYAEALGCRDEYLHIPVQPNWLDERELLGAVNPIAGMYDPSPVGLVERLIAAEVDAGQDRGGMYIVCLDEMNLARIEHYFAQFLSVIQHPREARVLRLFNRTAVADDDPYRDYDQIPINPNTRFVGTVNIDETTHFLSAKVLDRSQFIALQPPALKAGWQVSRVSSLPGITPVRASVYETWAQPRPVPPELTDFLCNLDEALRLTNQGLGFRRFELMQRYIGAAQGLMGIDEALDFQIRQTVLPRLRKNAYRFDEMLKHLQALIKPDRFPGSCSLLERIADSEADYEFFQLL